VTFFSLWALFGKSMTWIGPVISGVIIDRTGNTWKGFPFSLGFSMVGIVLIALVVVPKARLQYAAWQENDSTLSKEEQAESVGMVA
jgi:MFS-type transporter involved in bile tolerance (Atg22 family)